jgi:protein TonB
MTGTDGDDRPMLSRLREWSLGPPMQTSIFGTRKDQLGPGVLPDLLDFLRHPVRSIREDLQAPRTRASLFHHIVNPAEVEPLDWRGLIKDVVTGYRFALFIPSLWADPEELAEERASLRARRMEAGMASLMIHLMIVCLAVFFAIHRNAEEMTQKQDSIVFVSAPMNMPPMADDQNGGGGGGGGKHEKLPPSSGRLPDAARVQLMPPDPGMPKPLLPPEDAIDLPATVQMPIDLPTDRSLPIGDPFAPPSDHLSSGPGSEGGIGTGSGPGVGPGKGSGAGPGENGGYGNGPGGGIGDGPGPGLGGKDLILPEAISQPRPYYTEEARKARTEGMVVLQVMIRKNGTVDGIRVLKGLAYGLDESAVHTVAGKWRFRPATYRGIPIDFQAVIEVTFRLF